jgi:hypothetical protein
MKWIFLLSVLFPVQAFCWGIVGHRTIALVAETRLTPRAQAAVHRLLGNSNLVDVANWADAVRDSNTYRHTHSYHFETIGDHVKYLDYLKSQTPHEQKKSGTVAAILYANKVLRDPNASPASQTDALKFLVHFVGDIHQPLHSGRPGDVGGLTVPVSWYGAQISLHKLWDTTMITTGHRDILGSLWSEQASEAYAMYLVTRPMTPSVDFKDVESWLNESLALRLTIYDPLYNTDSIKYQAQHLAEVDQRIYSAGVRLAAMLNGIYANEPIPVLDIQLQTGIESVSGSLDQLINFLP